MNIIFIYLFFNLLQLRETNEDMSKGGRIIRRISRR